MVSRQVGESDRTGTRVLRGLLAGVTAGFVASFAMDRFQAAISAFAGGESDSEPATERAADAMAKQVTGDELPSADKPLAGQAVHYGLGVALGAAYAIAAEFSPSVTVGRGTAFGAATATLLDEAMVPAVGLGGAPWNASLGSNLYSYASHLVFGTVTELVRSQVRATLVPEPAS